VPITTPRGDANRRVGLKRHNQPPYVSLDEIFGFRAEYGFGIIIASARDEFPVDGKGFRVLIEPHPPTASHMSLSSGYW
jgi:hypothetical protein